MKNLALILILLCLTNCRMANISNSCPPVVNYTLEEQQEVDRIRQEVDSILLDRFLIDYGNLRENIRICNE